MLGLVLTLVTATQDMRLMTPLERKDFHIWLQYNEKIRPVSNENVEFVTQVLFKNETLCEVLKVVVRSVVRINGQVAYRSKPIALTSFQNTAWPHKGSLLPASRCLILPVTDRHPINLWTTRSKTELELDEVWVWNGKGSLRDPGHLFLAFMTKKSPEIRKLFEADPGLSKVRTSDGASPMQMAFSTGDLSMIKYLEKKGLDPRQKSAKGHTAMFLAAMSDDPSTLDYALKLGCRVNDALPNSGRTPLIKAVSEGRLAAVKWLIAHGANVNCIDKTGINPVASSILDGFPEMLKVLVAAKANIRYRSPEDRGYMHYCIDNTNMYPYVRALGISVDDAGPSGMTPLMEAADVGNGTAIEWLVRNGASLTKKDKAGRTARDYSRLSGSARHEAYFLEHVTAARGKK